MILRPFASGSKAATCHSTRPTPQPHKGGLGEENGREWPQKGDFNGQMSFAIASIEISINVCDGVYDAHYAVRLR